MDCDGESTGRQELENQEAAGGNGEAERTEVDLQVEVPGAEIKVLRFDPVQRF